MTDLAHIRNFCIVAHVDHGKSTLADRFLLHTKTIEERTFHDQILDAMDLEQERGITIKSHPVRMRYDADNGETYEFNLIDTPGHVDFSYEVSRSLAACEGAILLVDAAQGVQAQTMANVNLAIKQDLTIVPVINKVDLPAANLPMCLEQFEELLAIPSEEVLQVSAKTGLGVRELLEAVIQRVPPPKPTSDRLQALIFDSVYDVYRGVVTYVRIVNGSIKPGDHIKFFATSLDTDVKEVGFFSPGMKPADSLSAGEVALPGFQKISPMVFSGVYPIDTADYEALKFNIAKLRLNDSAFVAQPESSIALGAGFRCGFLGLLHMDVVQERLTREYNMDLILTYPSVIYHVFLKNGTMKEIDNPLYMPDPSTIDHVEEPMIKAQIISPATYMGNIMNLVLDKRGVCLRTETVDKLHVMITARMPLHEIVLDFYDKLKTCTRGYGSMDYDPDGYEPAPTVKLEILVNGEPVDAFASICHADRAVARARMICERLSEAIPPQMFKIAIRRRPAAP